MTAAPETEVTEATPSIAADVSSVTAAGPYAQGWADLFGKGWAPLALPYGRKGPPPAGTTGADGLDYSYADCYAVADDGDRYNVGIRLPADVLGIDVDAHDGRPGADTLATLEVERGPLPAGPCSTSRPGTDSRIMFVRVPPGLDWPGGLGPGIDVIQRRHRYAVVAPSQHPSGATYGWFDAAGRPAEAPCVAELPELPETWVRAVTGMRPEAAAHLSAGLDVHAADAWLNDREGSGSCRRVKLMAERAVEALRAGTGSSRHDTANGAVWHLAHLAGEGHPGVASAVSTVAEAFILAVADRTTEAEAAGEVARMIHGAVDAAAPLSTVDVDPCADPWAGLIAEGPRPPVPALRVLPPVSAAEIPADVAAVASPSPLCARLVNGADFLRGWGESVPAVWGSGTEVLWAQGESCMLVAPQGVGKTTLTGQLVKARLGLVDSVLGYPVAPGARRVLYLAMDRPRQIARSLARTFAHVDPDRYADRLSFWPGPPPEDVARDPNILVELAEAAGADTLVIDSVKDAAIGLSDDAVGAGYNRARQALVLAGVELLEQHHLVKKTATGGPPKELADVYGSVWLTGGAGSVILLYGKAGDVVVDFRQLKPPADEVGPFQVLHDHTAGLSTVVGRVDLLDLAIRQGGVTVRTAAVVLGAVEPDRNQIEKARRALDQLVAKGLLRKSEARPPAQVQYLATSAGTHAVLTGVSAA